MMNIFLTLFCLEIWTLERGFQVAAAVEGTWTQHYEAPYSDLVRGGQEGTDRWPTFICQAKMGQGVYPGKFVPGWSTCYIALGKSEESSRNFQVLRKSKSRSYAWVDPGRSGNDRKIKESAVDGGYTRQGKKLWICRTKSVKVHKGFWSGSATLVGNVEEGGEQCIAPWLESARGYSGYQVLIDDRPAPKPCVPTERFDKIYSVRNAGDSDQTFTRKYVTGIEKQRGSTNSFHHSSSNTESFGFSLGADIKGIKAGFEASVGKSEETGFDWTKTSNDVWTHSSTHIFQFNVKAGTYGTLEQLVGVCGDVMVRTPYIEVDSEPLDSEDLEE